VNDVGETVTVYVAVWPAVTVAEVSADDNAKFDPVPLRSKVCVAGVALSVTVKVPVCVPAAVGAKLIGILQLVPAARLLPQLELPRGNSLASEPATVMPLIVSVALPVLVNVIVCAALVVFTTCAAKSNGFGASPTAGAAAAPPVPVKVTVCGLDGASSATEIAAVWVPVALGWKSTAIMQFAPAANDDSHVTFVLANSLAFEPVIVTEVILSAAFPVFVRVTDSAPLVVPSGWLENVRLFTLNDTAGAGAAVPVPVSAIACGLLGSLSMIVRVAVSPLAADGLNVTSITQEPFAGTLVPLVHVVPLAMAKSPAFAPLIAGVAVILSAALPSLVIVTDWAELVELTFSLPNATLVGEMFITGPAFPYATVAQA
jgi:hypothetical protein